MITTQRYSLPLDSNLEGKYMDFDEFPDLDVIYQRASPEELSLLVNGQQVNVNYTEPSFVDQYTFRGIRTINKDGQRHIVFSISNDHIKTETHSLNQDFTVELAENPSTGYRWIVKSTPGLQIVADRYVSSCPPKSVGCGGTRVWTLRGTAVGDQYLIAEYRRPWEQSSVESKILLFNIIA